MKVFFCVPQLTMADSKNANIFISYCREIFDEYLTCVEYVSSEIKINQIRVTNIDKDSILVFFNAEDGNYTTEMIALITKFYDCQCRIWPIAMQSNSECRMPPQPVSHMQSFDVSCLSENRNPFKNNVRAIALIFARKIISQALSPLYRDEVLYFLSHRRIDGEYITTKLADQLRKLTRKRNVYRDVVNVEVGNDAQKDIDKNLPQSDVLIFLQTEQAKDSNYLLKELCFAMVNDIPILWLQIDNAQNNDMRIKINEQPQLRYLTSDFDDPDKLEDIANEIEEQCFKLIMLSSNQVFTYIQCLHEMNKANKIQLINDENSIFAYNVKYNSTSKDLYTPSTIYNHYVQCFGRNPQEQDFTHLVEMAKEHKIYDTYDRFFLLSNHGKRDNAHSDNKITEENYDDYFINIENVVENARPKLNKRIVISGAFPDDDPIYYNSLIEAVLVYCREIIKQGYTLVFGSHPTFQKLILDTGKLYASDCKYSIEMHMDKAYIHQYDRSELEKQCTLIVSDDLQKMRENMICKEKTELLICLGGKIKDDKSQQGVDVEVGLAQSKKIPVALVGTVGGRSSEFANEMLLQKRWSEINSFDKEFNESLFYNVNHRLMAKKLLSKLQTEL